MPKASKSTPPPPTSIALLPTCVPQLLLSPSQILIIVFNRTQRLHTTNVSLSVSIYRWNRKNKKKKKRISPTMAKKRKSDATRLDEVDRSMYTTFCSAANSLSQLYTQTMNHQRLSFQAGERHALVRSSSFFNFLHNNIVFIFIINFYFYMFIHTCRGFDLMGGYFVCLMICFVIVFPFGISHMFGYRENWRKSWSPDIFFLSSRFVSTMATSWSRRCCLWLLLCCVEITKDIRIIFIFLFFYFYNFPDFLTDQGELFDILLIGSTICPYIFAS